MIDSDAIPSALRAHFARHNRHALLFAALTLVAALVFWAVIYATAYWLTLLGLAVVRGEYAQVPAWFLTAFLIVALVLCGISYAMRRASPNELPRDDKSFFDICADFLLAVPRMTLAVWGNLSAYQFLTEREMRLAWRLLQKIGEQRRLGIHSVAAEIPDRRLEQKIVLALQLAGLIELKKTDDGFFLALHGDEARALCEPRVRIETGRRLPAE
jgi:hypothetical protein